MEWDLLASLGDEDRRALLASCRRQRFPRKGFIFHEGDPGDSLHLIASGTVAVRVTNPLGEVATLDVLAPGQSFGEQALVDPSSRRSATIVAVEKVETLRLAGTDFEALCRTHPLAHRALTVLLEARLRATSLALMDALYLGADKRVLRQLQRLTTIYGTGGDVTIPLTQDDLASMAGTTRQTVNKVLRSAEDASVVVLTRGRITVIGAEALARLAR